MLESMVRLFTEKSSNLSSIKEDLTVAEIEAEIPKTKFHLPDASLFKSIIEKTSIPNRDDLEINLTIDDMEPITFYKNNPVEKFIGEIDDLYKTINFDKITVKISIHKKEEDNKYSIYYPDLFFDYLNKQPLTGILYTFNEKLPKNEVTKFIIMNGNNKYNFYTKRFIFTTNEYEFVSEYNNIEIIKKRNEICNFLDAAKYNFIPDDFKLIKTSELESVNSLFNKLCNIFSLIFISDISNIEGNNNLFFKINGYKVIADKLTFDDFGHPGFDQLFSIYKWVYGEGTISDKIGLARNILSLYNNETGKFILKDNNNILSSIKSSYAIYLKENVSQYIEVKNKLTEYLLEISLRYSELVRGFSGALKNNNLLLVSFFVSAVISNALSGNEFKNIFNSYVTLVSYFILIISGIYFWLSREQITSELEHFKKQYKRLKNMYLDILNENDLERIFDEKTHNEDIEFAERQIRYYSNMWVCEITLIGILVLILSMLYK